MKRIILILAILVAINVTSALSCGETITESIVLTEDLTCYGNGIIIDADNIVVDGNGHFIEGDKTGIGIYVLENKGVIVKNLKIKNFEWGIGFIDDNTGNEAYNNIIEGNDAGILVAVFGTRNKIHDNEIRNNGRGIAITAFSNWNEIYNNKFIGNSDVGIRLLQSRFNLFYANRFVENPKHVDDLSSDNIYDNGAAGNYWDDYESNSGFPNTYIVNQYSRDNFPYWFQAKCGDVNADGKLTRSDISYLSNYVFNAEDPPMPLWTGDVNSDSIFDVLDVVSLINHVIRGKPIPSCGIGKNILKDIIP